MSITTKHRGYVGSIDVNVEDNFLHGKILHINDLITFEAGSPAGLQAAFEDSVDEYLADCEELGKEPNKPFSGTFNVRVGEDLHRECATLATNNGVSLNEFVCASLRSSIGVVVADGSIVAGHTAGTQAEALTASDVLEIFNYISTVSAAVVGDTDSDSSISSARPTLKLVQKG